MPRVSHEANRKCLAFSIEEEISISQPSLFITIIMSDPNPNSNPNQARRVVRKGRKYNAIELDQILPFKQSYLQAENVHQRAMVLHDRILPAIFNYWFSKGWNPTKEQEETTRKSKVWLRDLR
jgi:hypothetical protein